MIRDINTYQYIKRETYKKTRHTTRTHNQNPTGWTKRNAHKYKLAKTAETSFAWTHEFLKKLQAQKLAKGTQVTSYAGLINYWLQIKTKPEKRNYMHKNPINLIQKSNLPYALTF